MLTLPFGICLDHLTSIHIANFCSNTAAFLSKLDVRICHQIKEFKVNHIGVVGIYKPVNIAARFRNLIILEFPNDFVENADTKYLFESCTKLKQISLFCGCDDERWHRMLKHIKENCIDLKLLHLYQFDHTNNDTFPEVLNGVAKLFPSVE